MKVFVVTHSSADWKTVTGVFNSLAAVKHYYKEEYNRTENKLRWYNEYTGSFELPMNSFPIEINIIEEEVQ